jgi:hypothetical protein
MAKDLHENFAAGEVKPPSERSTGLLFATVAVILAMACSSDGRMGRAVKTRRCCG